MLSQVGDREESHEKELNFVDRCASNGSKVLLSSRVRTVLDGAQVVSIGLPSETEAVDMLLSVAGLSSGGIGSDVSAAAREIVKFCQCLPLLLGIAGSLCKEMAVSTSIHSWTGVLELLREEFAQNSHGRSMEETVIATSLRGICKGPQQTSILTLFKSFALLNEDTFCPLEMLSVLYGATVTATGSASDVAAAAPPRAQLRRWLKQLLDRSLILGSVDRPSLHDM